MPALYEPIVPTGDISVMPQACMTSTSYFFSKVSIIDGGHAEPPIMTLRKCGSFRSCASMCDSSICHTVGTAAEIVTCSVSSNS